MLESSLNPPALGETLASGDTLAASLPSSTADDLAVVPGDRIGRYFVLEELGAGGMGVVYAAYDPKLDRKVALKLLLASHAGEAARARLEREAQALAKLAHPHVVAVYDVDVHADQLYMAMELVTGRTLGAWMKVGEPRPWRSILAKLVDAGRGLAAAHAAGLVHRDFKPDNVMLGDDGRVRVMDFGLARPDAQPSVREDLRATGARRVDARALATPVTRTGALMGTPAYMAPEQFEGRADARSDQFGFCVALYEALYGQRPFTNESLPELLAAITAGRLEPERAGASVPAWLRAVVVRGLAADPDRRWPSMTALLDALLDDPAQRWRRRSKLAIAASLVLASAGSLAWALQSQAPTPVCAGFEDRLAQVWSAEQKAQVRAAIEGTNLSYAPGTWQRVEQRLDDYTQRWVAARRQTCEASQRGEQSGVLLDLRMRCLDERLQHVAATVGVLRQADEDVVRKAVEAVADLPTLDRCADVEAMTAEHPPPEHPQVAEQVAALDERLIAARALQRAGRYDAGLEQASSVATEAETLGHEPLHVRAGLLAGSLEAATGTYAAAEATLEGAYASAVGLGMKSEAAEAASLLVYLVGSKLARHDDARRWARHAGPLARAAGTDEAQAYYLNNLGLLAEAQGKYGEARGHYEQSLAIRAQELDPDHPHVAAALTNLGNVAEAEGEYERARGHHERALLIRTRALGPEHPDVAASLNNLGTLAWQEGKYEQARDHHERALAIREQALGPEHPDLASSLSNLGSVALREGEHEQARGYYERALAIDRAALGPDHPSIAASLSNLGGVAEGQGQRERAREHYEQALAILERAFGPDHPDVALCLTNLGNLSLAEGEHGQARAQQERALAIWEQALGPEHFFVAALLTNLGTVALAEEQYEEARGHQVRALAIWEQALGPEHHDLAYPLTGLGLALLGLAKPADALPHLERAVILRDAGEGAPNELAAARFALARALWDAPAKAGRDRERAEELAAQAEATYASADGSTRALAEIRAWRSAHAL